MKVLKRLLAGILAVVLLISLPTSSFEVSAASGIPGFKAKVTEKNILKIFLFLHKKNRPKPIFYEK